MKLTIDDINRIYVAAWEAPLPRADLPADHVFAFRIALALVRVAVAAAERGVVPELEEGLRTSTFLLLPAGEPR